MPTKTVERAKTEPKAKGLREPTYMLRQPAVFFDAISLGAENWRRLVGQAPVVRACIQTLIMQITGLNWSIESEDEKLAEYFEGVLNGADDGAGFENMVARVIEDTLTVPFGGAWEIGSYSDGTVAWLAHLDGGLMKPTYQANFPYAQLDPWAGALNSVLFRPGEVSRVMWQPQTNVRVYGWTRTPCMDCLPAIQGLLRSDRFWQTMMTDSPPVGILEVPGFNEDEARDWLEGWKTMVAGIDALKVPVLYGGSAGGDNVKAAQFIALAPSATEAQLPELVKRYAEMVCAAFGMNVGDLGLFGQELRLAGATKLIELSKRQGLAHVLRRIKQRLDSDVLPDGVEFVWEDVELEDTIRRESARKIRADAIANLASPMIGVISPDEARQQLVADGILTVELPENAPAPPEKPATATPTGDEAITTKGTPEAQAGRSRPFAPVRQGADEDTRASPTTSKAAREMGRLVGPWIAKIAASVTSVRIAALLKAGIAAAQKAGGMEGATATLRILAPSAAEQAIGDLLANEDWWRAPDIADRAAQVLGLAYSEGLVETAQDIQRRLAANGIVPSIHVGISIAQPTDPALLKALDARAYGLITNVDEGTDFLIRREIMAGVRAGISSPSIARRILVEQVRQGIVQFSRGRALTIVNTEINWASTQAALKQQASVGLTKRVWKGLPDACDDICQPNIDMGPIGPDESFEDAWGSCDGPPGHPSCLCWVTFDMGELREISGQPDYYTGEA